MLGKTISPNALFFEGSYSLNNNNFSRMCQLPFVAFNYLYISNSRSVQEPGATMVPGLDSAASADPAAIASPAGHTPAGGSEAAVGSTWS